MKIGENFSEQLRIAADDSTVTIGTMRQGLKDAADVIETQNVTIAALVSEADFLRLVRGILCGLILMAIGVGLAIWSLS